MFSPARRTNGCWRMKAVQRDGEENEEEEVGRKAGGGEEVSHRWHREEWMDREEERKGRGGCECFSSH